MDRNGRFLNRCIHAASMAMEEHWPCRQHKTPDICYWLLCVASLNDIGRFVPVQYRCKIVRAVRVSGPVCSPSDNVRVGTRTTLWDLCDPPLPGQVPETPLFNWMWCINIVWEEVWGGKACVRDWLRLQTCYHVQIIGQEGPPVHTPLVQSL